MTPNADADSLYASIVSGIQLLGKLTHAVLIVGPMATK